MLVSAAEGLAILAYAAARGPKPSLGTAAKLGALNFLAFHRVTLVVRTNGSAFYTAGFSNESIRFSFALMSGTLLAMSLLGVAGRRAGRDAGGRAWERGVHGAKVAIPYAGFALLVALVARVPSGSRGASPAVHASIPSAIVWPLGLALIAGTLGGCLSESDRAPSTARRDRLLHGALVGGVWMIGIGLALAFVGLVSLAPIKSEATRAYFGPFKQGKAEGLALIGYTLLAVPNLAAWVLFPSMGSCVGIAASGGGLRVSGCVLSYTRFPSGRGLLGLALGSTRSPLLPAQSFPHPRPGYYAFVLAPAIAVLVGGAIASRRARADSRREAALAGALAGVLFGLMALLVAMLAEVVVAEVANGGVDLRAGPPVVASALIALGWGVLGGAAGGALWGRAPSRGAWTSTEASPGSG